MMRNEATPPSRLFPRKSQALVLLAFLGCDSDFALVQASGFPDTLRASSVPNTSGDSSYWHHQQQTTWSSSVRDSKHQNSDDEGGDTDDTDEFEEETSSSDWTWEDESQGSAAAAVVSAMSESAAITDQQVPHEQNATKKIIPTNDGSGENAHFKQDIAKGDTSRNSAEAPPSETSTSTNSEQSRAKAGTEEEPDPMKPLHTLEKLQQMLDETDYMTSKSGGSTRHTFDDEDIREENKISENAATRIIENQSMEDEVPQDEDEGGPQRANPEQTNAKHKLLMKKKLGPINGTEDTNTDQLWTSKDRMKYKKQQQLHRRREEYARSMKEDPYRIREYQQQKIHEQHQRQMRIRRQQQQQQLEMYRRKNLIEQMKQRTHTPERQASFVVSDAEDFSETDDGLGYELPNFPIYLSDAEGDYDTEIVEREGGAVQPNFSTNDGRRISNAPLGSENPSRFMYTDERPDRPSNVGSLPDIYEGQLQQQLYRETISPHQQPFTQGGSMVPQLSEQLDYQHMQVTPNGFNQYFPYQMYPQSHPFQIYPYPHPFFQSPTNYQRSIQEGQQPQMPPTNPQSMFLPYTHQSHPVQFYPKTSLAHRPSPTVPPIVHDVEQSLNDATQSGVAKAYGSKTDYEPASQLQSLAKSIGSRLTFVSGMKVAACFMIALIVSYAAVSPQALSQFEYNRKFYENIRVISWALLPPAIISLFVMDMKENNINHLVSCFFNAFTVGYAAAFLCEIVSVTLVRLCVFWWWEPNIFSLIPQIPIPILPWVLRENKYRPKRITLFVADFIASCVVSPFIEEFVKLMILRVTVSLPRNFRWVIRASKSKKRKCAIAEPILRDEKEVTKINNYVTNMLAVSIGLKLADAGRRINMYTKATQTHRSFYAICRGVFPIHELCGTVTALGLARRDVLGQHMPLWKMVLPAAVIHGMANFRGMKPFFKWGSSTPWSEMQLYPHVEWGTAATFAQLVNKAFPKVMWLIILMRVLGYCIKNYYLINRQATKRTTTYAGKHSAFSAELAAAEMLKQTKKEK